MKTIISFLGLLLIYSCGQTEQNVVNEIRVVHNDHFLNGKKSIDSLKELSVQEGLKGNLTKIKDLCELVAKLDSNDADNLSRLAMVYMIEKQNDKGLTTINRSIRHDTGHHLTHNLAFKACLFKELNSKDSADLYFVKMLQTKNYGLDLNAIAQSYFMFKNNDKGYEYNDLTLKYYPLNEEANLTEAMRLYQTNPKEAIEMLTRLEKNVKTARIYAERSLFYHNMDKFNLALADADKAVEMSHGEPWIVTGRGRTKHLLKDYKGAENDYKYSIDRGDTAAKRFYGLLLKDMNGI
jgi:tetratricopeptide (TPR) repeat protein